MNLKKSDKIIAVVGVVILIVAAIAIIFYMGEEEPTNGMPDDDEKMFEFVVKTNVYKQTILAEESHEVKDKLIGDSPTKIDVEIPIDDLKNAEIYVKFTDAQKINFLKRLTEDTLTVVVKDEDGNKIDSGNIVGNGNVTIDIPGGKCQNFGIIYAEDIIEANERLEENLTETGEIETYTVTVSISYKGLFERLRADNFKIEVTGEYYDYKVVETGNEYDNPSDDNNELSQDEPDYITSAYKYLSYPGFH